MRRRSHRLHDFAKFSNMGPEEAETLIPSSYDRGERRGLAEARALIRRAGHPIRTVTAKSSNKQRACLWFDPRISPQLNRVLVLDASFRIRKVQTFGGNITVEEIAVDAYPDFDFSALRIDWFEHRSGYKAIQDDLAHRGPLAKKLADWIKNTVPDEDPVLIWTFIKRGRDDYDPTEGLLKVLKRQGIDPSRIQVATHGSGRGSNEFQDHKWLAWYGVFERTEVSVMADMCGQANDLRADLSEATEVFKSEVLHELYQELARGGPRDITDDRGGPCGAFLPCRFGKEIIDQLAGPGCFPKAILNHLVEGKDETPTQQTCVAAAASAVLAEGGSKVGKKISGVKLKRLVEHRVGFTITDGVWKNSLPLWSAAGWTRVKRSYVYQDEEIPVGGGTRGQSLALPWSAGHETGLSPSFSAGAI